MFDLLLQGGTVVDGTGAAGQRAEVALVGDRIAQVGTIGTAPARRTVDIAGLVVAPGFIDVHNHSDGWLLKQRHFVAKTSQGFTTEVLASDGISYAPISADTARDWITYLRPLDGLAQHDYRGWQALAEYADCLHGATAQNVVMQIPYANVRVLACGWGRAAADDVQINLMRGEVRRSMEAGAVGVSTGLDYIAQSFATTDELVAVCRELAAYDGLYATHVRYKRGTLEGLREAVEIGRRAGIRVHISHLKGMTPQEVEELLDYVDRVAVNEVDFSFDIYPYMSGSTLVSSLLPYEAWEEGPLAVPARLRNPALVRRFAELLAGHRSHAEQIRLAWVATKDNADVQGLSIAEFAARRGKPLAEALVDLLIDEQLAVLAVFRADDDRLVEPFLAHPKQMLGTDAIYTEDGPIHPRIFGSAARMLGPLVRDRRLFTLEEAVRKMTGYPAERFGLVDRGVIREGAFADLVVFDPATITDCATYDDSRRSSEGVAHVFVNGIAIITGGKPATGIEVHAPGRVLRFRNARSSMA